MTQPDPQRDPQARTWLHRIARAARRVIRMTGIDIVRHPPEISGVADIAHLLQLNRIDVVLDVGANIGQYAKQVRRRGYRGRIVSFEPVVSNHTSLAKAAARDTDWIVAPRMALGEEDGETEVQVSAYSDMSSLLPATSETQTAFPRASAVAAEPVGKRKLDSLYSDYVQADERSFLKLDTQGFERHVLDGAERVLPLIQGLQLELSLVPLYEGESLFDELHERVCSLGFEPYLFAPGFYSRRIGRQLQVDCVYFRKAKPK